MSRINQFGCFSDTINALDEERNLHLFAKKKLVVYRDS